MTTTIHLRVSEKTKEKYYQRFYTERSKDTKLDHDEFMLKLLLQADTKSAQNGRVKP